VKKEIGSCNSVSVHVECKTRAIADRLYWAAPASARMSLSGVVVMLDVEENKKSAIATLRLVRQCEARGELFAIKQIDVYTVRN
jgi:hypothetical protein